MEAHHARRIVHVFEWLLYIGGFLFVILGILFIAFQQFLPFLFPQYPFLAKLQESFGVVTGFMLIVWGAASFWVGHGFHHYHKNARHAFLALSVIVFLGSILGAYTTKTQFWIWGLLAVVQIWLFGFQKEIVHLFGEHVAPIPVLARHKRKA